MGNFRDRVRAWLGIGEKPLPAERAEMKINPLAEAEARMGGREARNPWTLPEPPAGMIPGYKPADMAMDRAPYGDAGGMSIAALYQWAGSGLFSEGLGFLGYPYLAELMQRP
jgi:hypothetical protein